MGNCEKQVTNPLPGKRDFYKNRTTSLEINRRTLQESLFISKKYFSTILKSFFLYVSRYIYAAVFCLHERRLKSFDTQRATAAAALAIRSSNIV